MEIPPEQRAFVAKRPELVNVLMTQVWISLPLEERKNAREFIGIWDTGATHSVVTKKVVDALGLKPITKVKVNHVGGEDYSNVYLVNIALPSNVIVQGVRVTEGKLPSMSNANVLIGMDIISHGDFAVTNFSGKTTFSFRTPSIEEIDFVSKANLANFLRAKKIQQFQKSSARNKKKLRWR